MALLKAVQHQTKIDLSEATRADIIELLNQQLATLSDLYSQTKQAHWNVKGPDFIALHELFDKLAGETEGFIDTVAERVTSLGGVAHGTVRMAAKASTLPEFPADIFDGVAYLKLLVDRYAAEAAIVRAAIDTADQAGDATTADLFTQVSAVMDKNLWFLEAHLQG